MLIQSPVNLTSLFVPLERFWVNCSIRVSLWDYYGVVATSPKGFFHKVPFSVSESLRPGDTDGGKAEKKVSESL